ncbi:MAG: replication restart helicase PriA [Desulfosudaceae bacterium]
MNQPELYIEVAVTLPVHKTYTYRVPEALAPDTSIGKRVTVPFGRRSVTGYVLGPASPEDPGAIKPITNVLDETPLFPASMTDFFRWIAAYYLYPPGEAIKSALPAGSAVTGTSFGVARRSGRDSIGEIIEPDTPPALTADQENIVTDVVDRMGRGFFSCLLEGVTGSGKTEVYLRIARAALQADLTALVLVPEIALISQAERRFKARFGEQIVVLHSGLTRKERQLQWMRIARNQVRLAIGTRSAIFAPFESLGVIIVDEEHDGSYKQDGSLRYHARDLALLRAKLSDCIVMLGSATPSLQSLYNARSGKLSKIYRLNTRINSAPLPAIDIVDLRESGSRRGPGGFISERLYNAIRETLAEGNQALLFLNRRGYASFPVCAACGQSIKCRYCDITMTLHRGVNAYRCHFCGYTRPAKSGCDQCGSASVKQLGLGTEKVEETVRGLFPEAAVDRLDRDTTTRKGSIARILKDIRNRRTDILIGTQMVAKGHDFPGITLIGIICADLSLNFPDFRAGEMTFQLLAQVAGRAGRGSSPGRVIMQTYNPDHFSVSAATRHDVSEFYEREIEFRRQLVYPPYARLIHLRISGKDQDKTGRRAREVGQLCASLKAGDPGRYGSISVLGPVESPVHKLAGRFRWQILLKSVATVALKEYTGRLLAENATRIKRGGIRLVVDVDPYMMM